jgi:formylglycine-generating enzyme required for sulfatase activity
MLGNVWEWSHDWYGPYGGSVNNPIGPTTGSVRGVRGGSWLSDSSYLRSADRFYGDPSFRFNFIGFRLARTAN